MTTAQDIIDYMESLRDEEQARHLMRFFKTAPGQYGHGDQFLGIKNPQVHQVVKLVSRGADAPNNAAWGIAAQGTQASGRLSRSASVRGSVAQGFPLSEIPPLLMSPWHEVRLCGFLLLVSQFERLATKRLAADPAAIRRRDEILTLYLQYAERANNWDLVDLTAPKLLGHWLLLPTFLGGQGADLHTDYKRRLLDDLAASPCLWKQRMSIVCTWKTSQQGDPTWCLRYAEIHLHHPHDLMHKAVGWMLREMGKRVSMDLLRDFLRQHAATMPRTALRYAIERMPEGERRQWMNLL